LKFMDQSRRFEWSLILKIIQEVMHLLNMKEKEICELLTNKLMAKRLMEDV